MISMVKMVLATTFFLAGLLLVTGTIGAVCVYRMNQ